MDDYRNKYIKLTRNKEIFIKSKSPTNIRSYHTESKDFCRSSNSRQYIEELKHKELKKLTPFQQWI